MKQIIIFLLLVILGVLGYNLYTKYERFSLKNYSYQPLENISVTEENKRVLLDYHKAIEAVNGYVITQWSVNDIDVRRPEDNDEVTNAAVREYGNKLATVKYYETLLKNPEQPKSEGENAKRKELLKKLLSDSKALSLGQSNAAVYELQKLLVKRGYDIPLDGFYKTITLDAVKKFEEKHKLFPDGKMDVLTLEALLD